MPEKGDLILELPPRKGGAKTIAAPGVLYTANGTENPPAVLGRLSVEPSAISYADGFFLFPTQMLIKAVPSGGKGEATAFAAGQKLEGYNSFVELADATPDYKREIVITGGFTDNLANNADPKSYTYVFDGAAFPNMPLIQPRLGSVEEWKFVNHNNDEDPIHIHAAEAGRFPWRAPLGYVNIGGKEGPNIKPDDKRAPFIRRAFDLMATGRYLKTDVLKMVTDDGYTTLRGKPLSPQTFQALLRNPLYVGWITLPSDEDFKPVRGLHEPITSQETFDRVQAILDGRTPSAAPKRKFNPALPLKCLVKCEACGTPLTGALCAWRNGKFAYYWCRKGGCRAVKIRSERLEEKLLTLLKGLRPHDEIISKFLKLAAKAWADKQGDSQREAKRLEARLAEQKKRKRRLLDSMLEGKVSEATYSEADEEFRAEIAVSEAELLALNSQQSVQDAFLRFAELHLMDIARAWQSAGPKSRQRVQNLLFEDGLHYSTEAGILNRSKSSLFSMLQAVSDEKG